MSYCMLMTSYYCLPLLHTSNDFSIHLCENELAWSDMAINVKKSGCLRVGPRCDIECTVIRPRSTDGRNLTWITELRYLGVYFVNSRTLKCSLNAAKRGFYRAVNSIFGKVWRIASEEVVLHLTTSKCMPILLYDLEALPLNKSPLSSLDFMVNRFLMKLFNSNDMQTIEFLPSVSPSVCLPVRHVGGL